MSNATEEKAVSLEDVLMSNCVQFGFDLGKSEPPSFEEILKENQEITRENTKLITGLSNDLTAVIKELQASASSITHGAELAQKALNILNDLTAGCHRSNQQNHRLITSVNEVKREANKAAEEAEDIKRERNIAAMLLGTRLINDASCDSDLMEVFGLD